MSNLYHNNAAAATEINDFGKQFSSSTKRVTDGRGQRKVLDDAVSALLMENVTKMLEGSALHPVVLEGAAWPPDTESVQKAAACTCFGFSAGVECVPLSEKWYMPCLRISMKGSRSLRLFSLAEVTEHLGKSKITVSAGEWLATAGPRGVGGVCLKWRPHLVWNAWTKR